MFNILGEQLNHNSDDGFCNRMSDTLDPQNGRKSRRFLRKLVMYEAIQAQVGALQNLYRFCLSGLHKSCVTRLPFYFTTVHTKLRLRKVTIPLFSFLY